MADLKTRRALLASASRTATTICPKQTDASQQFLRVILHVTGAGTTLKPIIRGYGADGAPYALNGATAGSAGAGTFIYELMRHDAAPAGDVKETLGRALPCVWDVQVQHADATPTTYTLSCEVFPPGS